MSDRSFHRIAIVWRHRRHHRVPRCHRCLLLDCPRRSDDGSGWFNKYDFYGRNTFIHPRADRYFTYVTIVRSFYFVGYWSLFLLYFKHHHHNTYFKNHFTLMVKDVQVIDFKVSFRQLILSVSIYIYCVQSVTNFISFFFYLNECYIREKVAVIAKYTTNDKIL